MARKNKGGRPRKSGEPAKSRIRNPKTGSMIQDTPANRKKFGIGETDAPAPIKTRSDSGAFSGAATATASQGQGHDAAADAVRNRLTADDTPGAAPSAAPGVPVVISINYTDVVQMFNRAMARKSPEAKMLPREEEDIGKALDAVIAKHFPELKNAGPEIALTLAIGGYFFRAILPILFPEKIEPTPEEKLTPGATPPPEPTAPSIPRHVDNVAGVGGFGPSGGGL